MNRLVAGCLVLICLGCQSGSTGSSNPPSAPLTAPTETKTTSSTPTSPKKPEKPARQYTVKDLAGTWQGQVGFSDNVPQNVRQAISKDIASNVTVLRTDKTFSMTDEKQQIEGTWQIEGQGVILTRKKVNGMSQQDYVNQQIEKRRFCQKVKAISNASGRLDISQDGKTLLSPTPNPQIIVMLVRKKK